MLLWKERIEKSFGFEEVHRSYLWHSLKLGTDIFNDKSFKRNFWDTPATPSKFPQSAQSCSHVPRHSLNNHILPVPYQLYKRSTRANGLRDKTSTLGDILQSLLLSSAVADKCRRNCQNANSSLTDFCLVLFWEHSPWWTSLFSSIFFVELSSREANPRCSVALLCDASPSTACWLVLFSFFCCCCLYWFTQMHTRSVRFMSLIFLHSE